MKQEEFIDRVKKLANLHSENDTLKVIAATSEVLSERLNNTTTQKIATSLPPEVGKFFKTHHEEQGESFSIEEFFDRVSGRLGEQVKQTVQEVRAVTEVIQEALPPQVTNDLYQFLPYEFRQLFDAGPPLDESRSETI